MYLKKIWDFGWVKQVEKCYPGNYGAPGVKRGKKRKKTPEDIERQNKTNKEKKLQRLILANYKNGGWHLILNYRPKDRPDSFGEAKENAEKFVDKMRNKYKKAGIPFKYIIVNERGKRGALHHHLIIEDIAENGLNTVQLIKKLWKYGNANFIDLYEDGEYKNLAEYIVKKETKDNNEWATYSRSRNMIIPEPEKEIIHRRTWKKEPKPEKGFYIIADSVVNGINPVTGYPYQHYAMRILGEEEPKWKSVST